MNNRIDDIVGFGGVELVTFLRRRTNHLESLTGLMFVPAVVFSCFIPDWGLDLVYSCISALQIFVGMASVKPREPHRMLGVYYRMTLLGLYKVPDEKTQTRRGGMDE